MATSTSAITLNRPVNSRRRLLAVAGGIVLAAAAIAGGTAAMVNVAAAPTQSFAVGPNPATQDQLRQHVLRENGSTLAPAVAPADPGSMTREHLLRENRAAFRTGAAVETLAKHVIRENGN